MAVDNARIQSIMQKVCTPEGWVVGNFYKVVDHEVLDCTGQPFVALDTHGAQFQAESKNFKFNKARGLPGRVWEFEEYEWQDNVQRLDPTKYLRQNLAASTGIKACLGVPYKEHGVVVGVVEFFSLQERQENEAEAQSIVQMCA